MRHNERVTSRKQAIAIVTSFERIMSLFLNSFPKRSSVSGTIVSEKGTSKARKSRTISDILKGGTVVDSCSEACRCSIVEIRMSLPQMSLVMILYQLINGFTRICYEEQREIFMFLLPD